MAAGGSIWARGRAMEAPARGVEERRKLWRDAWEGHVKLEVAGWPRAAVAAPLRRRSERKQGSRQEEEEVDWFAISEIPGTQL